MKTIQGLLWLCLMCLVGCGSESIIAHSGANEIEFRSGLILLPSPLTSIDVPLLEERDGYATTLTDPEGNIWELNTAEGLEPGDFREAGFMPSLDTEPAFYHRRIDFVENEDMMPECAVYIEAGSWQFAVLRRGEDQAPCPGTTDEYIGWLPKASMKSTKSESGKYENKHAALTFGAYTGTFNGVNSYSNNYPGYYCPDFKPWSQCTSYVGDQLAGVKWQCVEYADRYYLSVYNHSNLWKGHAKYWYSKATQYGLKAYPNCGTTGPKVGDMLVSGYGSYGHIAIVRSVGSSSISVIQQNWFENEKDNNHTISMNTANGKFCVSGFGGSSYPVTGWIRK